MPASIPCQENGFGLGGPSVRLVFALAGGSKSDTNKNDEVAAVSSVDLVRTSGTVARS